MMIRWTLTLHINSSRVTWEVTALEMPMRKLLAYQLVLYLYEHHSLNMYTLFSRMIEIVIHWMPLTLQWLCHTQLMILICYRKSIWFAHENVKIVFSFQEFFLSSRSEFYRFANNRKKNIWLFLWSIWYYEILRIEAVELKAQVYTRNACQRLAPPNRTKLKRLVNAKSDHDRLLKHDTSRMHAQCARLYGRKGLVSLTESTTPATVHGIEVSNKRKSNLFTSHSFISHASFVCARTQNRWWARRDDGEMFRTICTWINALYFPGHSVVARRLNVQPMCCALHAALLRIIASTANSSYSHSKLGFIVDVRHSLHAPHE